MDAKLRCAVLISSAALTATAAFVKSTEAGGQEPTTVNQPLRKAAPPPVCVPTQGQQSSAEAQGEPRLAAHRGQEPTTVNQPVHKAAPPPVCVPTQEQQSSAEAASMR